MMGSSTGRLPANATRRSTEQRWGGRADPSVCYEVIRIRRREGFQIGARLVEAAEVYPNSEGWGIDGFTLADRDGAFGKLCELV